MEKFVVKKIPTFDIAQTLECGQVFRYGYDNGVWHVNSLDHILYIKDNGNEYEMETDDVEYFKHYLDLERDYEAIQKEVQDNGFVSEAIEYGKGVRVLNQDPFEMLFSFIVSQNNNIPRIKGTIEKFCKYLGKDMNGYYAFPTLEALASKDVNFYKECGCGYRAEYIKGIAEQMLDEGFPDLDNMSTEEAREKLMSYKGIGRKVADCILLFGLGRKDVFPVDTWIYKVFKNEFPGASPERMATLLCQKYKKNCGFVQQWVYFYKRNCKKI